MTGRKTRRPGAAPSPIVKAGCVVASVQLFPPFTETSVMFPFVAAVVPPVLLEDRHQVLRVGWIGHNVRLDLRIRVVDAAQRCLLRDSGT
jgi:hypothetical protein